MRKAISIRPAFSSPVCRVASGLLLVSYHEFVSSTLDFIFVYALVRPCLSFLSFWYIFLFFSDGSFIFQVDICSDPPSAHPPSHSNKHPTPFPPYQKAMQ